ncbi:MAG: LysR family transcriptional regulator [bacterium]
MDLLTSMATFVRVVERGSIAAAAKDLGLSATMVGKHLFALEARLGTQLLQRTTRRQSLTEAGAAYFERCKQLLAAVSDAEASVQSLRKAPRGVLRVASPVTFGVQRLAPALAAYLRQNREVGVELTLNDRATELVKDGHEAAIRIGKLPDSSLIARPLEPYRMLVCASPDYIARHGTPQVPEDLSRHNCLGHKYTDRRDRWRLIGPDGEHRVNVHGNFVVNDGAALRTAALAGMGVTMQPEVLLADDVAAGRLVAVLSAYTPPARPMYLVYLPDRRATPKLRSFIDFIVERFGSTAASRQAGASGPRHRAERA